MRGIKLIDLRKYVRNVIGTSGLTICAQAISILTTPILSRIYTPADYGVIAVFLSVIAIMEACASLSYVSGIALDKELEDAKATTLLCIYLTIIIGVLSAFVVYFISYNNPSEELLKYFVFILPIMIIFPDISAAYQGWLKRCKKYYTIGILNIVNVGLLFLFNLIFGINGFGAKGLLFAKAISAICITVITYIVTTSITNYRQFRVKLTDIIRQAQKHRRFPLFQMPLVIMNSFSGQLPTVIMASFYNDNDLGLYSKATSISSIPSQVIGKSVAAVYYQECALVNERELKEISLFTYKRLLLISAVFVFFLAAFGRVIFCFVLGSAWEMAGTHASIIAPMVASIFITQPLSNLLFVKNKQVMGIPIGIIMIIIRAIALFGSIYFKLSFETMLFAYSVSSTIMYLFINAYYLRIVRIGAKYSLLLSSSVLFITWIVGLLIERVIL